MRGKGGAQRSAFFVLKVAPEYNPAQFRNVTAM